MTPPTQASSSTTDTSSSKTTESSCPSTSYHSPADSGIFFEGHIGRGVFMGIIVLLGGTILGSIISESKVDFSVGYIWSTLLVGLVYLIARE